MNFEQREILADITIQLEQLQGLTDTIATLARAGYVNRLRDGSLGMQITVIDEKLASIIELIKSDALNKVPMSASVPEDATFN